MANQIPVTNVVLARVDSAKKGFGGKVPYFPKHRRARMKTPRGTLYSGFVAALPLIVVSPSSAHRQLCAPHSSRRGMSYACPFSGRGDRPALHQEILYSL